MEYFLPSDTIINTENDGLKLRDELTERLSTVGLDLIILRFNYHYLNGNLWKNWTNTNISIERHGRYGLITLHPPLINSEEKLLKQIIMNLVILDYYKVFSEEMSKCIQSVAFCINFNIPVADFCANHLFSQYFAWSGLEICYDFDLKPYNKPRKKVFNLVKGTTYYSKLDWNKRKKLSKYGKEIVKDTQYSFISMYDRQKKAKLPNERWRIEFCFYGKYTKRLSMPMLLMTPSNLISTLKPYIGVRLRQLLKPEEMDLSYSVIGLSNPDFKQLIDETNWFPGTSDNQPKAYFRKSKKESEGVYYNSFALTENNSNTY